MRTVSNYPTNADDSEENFFPSISFDDGYSDVYYNAYPLLFEKEIPFMAFIVPDFIGKEGYMTKEQIVELSNNPLCTIGSHTMSHKMLRFCDDKDAKVQITDSKTFLEDLLGKEIEYFAYPYGSVYACSKRDIRLVQEAGYKYAFSTLSAPIPIEYEKMKYFLPRININENNYSREFIDSEKG